MRSTVTCIPLTHTQIGDKQEGITVHKGSNSPGGLMGNSGTGKTPKGVNLQQFDGGGFVGS